MIKIILHGYRGKMGQTLMAMIEKIDHMEVVAGIDQNKSEDFPFETFEKAKDCHIKGDVIIDFSNHAVVHEIIDFAEESKTPIVIATTGLSEETYEKINKLRKIIPVFMSANMSIGINVMAQCLKKITEVVEASFHIEIIEKHHALKVDAPSGTALLLSDAIKDASKFHREEVYGRVGVEEKRTMEEIGIHAIRGGTIPGEHTVIFAGDDEIIEIKHTALSRKIFAKGALEAAVFIKAKKPGLYSMNQLTGSEE